MENYNFSLHLFGVSLLSFIWLCAGQTYYDTQTLHNSLMMNYSKDIKPVLNQSLPIELTVHLSLKSLNLFEEVEGRLCLFVGMFTCWTDELFRWNPNDYGNVTYLSEPVDKMWNPTLYILNAFGDAVPTTKGPSIEYNYKGQALYQYSTPMEIVCTPQITYYPYDIHTCEIELSTMSLMVPLVTAKIFTEKYKDNAEWNLLRTTADIKPMSNLNKAVFYITFERRITFLMINVIPPILFIGVLNPLAFVLPVESGERISFSMTVLLSFAVFVSLIADKMPPTSNTVSVFSIYLLLMLMLSSGVVVTTVITLCVYHTDDKKPLPSSARKIIRLNGKFWRGTARKSNAVKVLQVEPIDQKHDLSKMNEALGPEKLDDDKDNDSQQTSDWKLFAKSLDTIFLAFFLISMSLITLSFFVIIFNR